MGLRRKVCGGRTWVYKYDKGLSRLLRGTRNNDGNKVR